MANYGQKKITFTAEEDDYLRANYGAVSAAVLGAAIGRSPDAVKRRARKLALARLRKPAGQGKKILAKAAKPFVAQTRFLAGSDQDLVAQFLAANEVTIIPAGYACGLTRIEQQLYTARPPSSSLRERYARHRAKAAKA